MKSLKQNYSLTSTRSQLKMTDAQRNQIIKCFKFPLTRASTPELSVGQGVHAALIAIIQGQCPPKNIDLYIFLLHIYSAVCRVVKNTAIDPFWNVGNAISKRLECIKFQSSLQEESLQRPQTPSCIIDRYATSKIVLCPPPHNFAPAPGLTCISCTELIICQEDVSGDPKFVKYQAIICLFR